MAAGYSGVVQAAPEEMDKYTRVQKEKEPTGENEIRISSQGPLALRLFGSCVSYVSWLFTKISVYRQFQRSISVLWFGAVRNRLIKRTGLMLFRSFGLYSMNTECMEFLRNGASS